VESYLAAQRLEDGLKAVTRGLEILQSNGLKFAEAELHRLNGELLLIGGNRAAEVESSFRQAIEVARGQSAKWFELRATMSLARLLASQGRRDEARTKLAEIYNWFTEGFDTADLRDAKSLLDDLAR
jgi:predicted ATPase